MIQSDFSSVCLSCVDLYSSDLQWWANRDDFVAISSIYLHQHRNCLLQHWTTDVEEATTRFVHSYVGDLAVSGGHCSFTDTASLVCLLEYKRSESEGRWPIVRLNRQLSWRWRAESFPLNDDSNTEWTRSTLWSTGSSWSFPRAGSPTGFKLALCCTIRGIPRAFLRVKGGFSFRA